MKASKTHGVIFGDVTRGFWVRCSIPTSAFFLLLPFLAISCIAAELKQKTVDAFDHYVRATDARMGAELRPGGPFLWVDSCPNLGDNAFMTYSSVDKSKYARRRQKRKANPLKFPMVWQQRLGEFQGNAGHERDTGPVMDLDYDNHWRTLARGTAIYGV